jgi:prepilin-type N-terminal cleavage/methylation domain-containing protein
MANERTRGAAGFSLLEIIAVLVLFGLLAAFVMEDADMSVYDVVSERNNFITNLRYAQTLAFAQSHLPNGVDENMWGIQLAGSSYTLTMDGAAQVNVNMPGQSSATYNLPSGITISGATVNFDFRGRPVTAINVPIGGDSVVTISGDGSSESVIVIQNTGLIQ